MQRGRRLFLPHRASPHLSAFISTSVRRTIQPCRHNWASGAISWLLSIAGTFGNPPKSHCSLTLTDLSFLSAGRFAGSNVVRQTARRYHTRRYSNGGLHWLVVPELGARVGQGTGETGGDLEGAERRCHGRRCRGVPDRGSHIHHIRWRQGRRSPHCQGQSAGHRECNAKQELRGVTMMEMTTTNRATKLKCSFSTRGNRQCNSLDHSDRRYARIGTRRLPLCAQ